MAGRALLVAEHLGGDGGPLVVVGKLTGLTTEGNLLTGLTTVSQGLDGSNCLVASVEATLSFV